MLMMKLTSWNKKTNMITLEKRIHARGFFGVLFFVAFTEIL